MGSGGVGGATGGGAGTGAGGTTGFDPHILFDSDRAGSPRHLYVVRLDGSGLRRVTSQSVSETEPAVSSNAAKLAYVTWRDGTPQIDVIDVPTGRVSPVTRHDEGARKPAFSPSGDRIAFRSGPSIFTVAIDGSDERHLTTAPSTGDFGGPVYTSDGQWIVYDGANTITAVRPDGTGQHPIAHAGAITQSFPTASPDGAWVAVQAICADPANAAGIRVAPFTGIAGSACRGRRLSPVTTEADCMHPAWGSHSTVAWDQGKAEGDIVVWKGDVVGWPEQDVVTTITTGPSDDRNPAWSPGPIPPL